MTTFTAETYQNEYLPASGTEVNAIVTVTASGGGGAGSGQPPPSAAEIIIVDVSGSMNYPGAKLRAAKDATAAAIDCIRDGVNFGVIAGAKRATEVFPGNGALVPAMASTRAGAKEAVKGLMAGGGTAMGQWLERARALFEAEREAAIRHAILLTDGLNESESQRQLDRAIERCAGVYQCDCRGVGTDWEVSELRRIASMLLGTVDIVPDPSGLEADFRAMMQQAMGKDTSSVTLRVWAPKGATVAFVKQVSPTIEDLTGKRQPADDLTAEYPTGAWGQESRDYHVCINVPAREVGDEMLAARVSLVVDGEVVSQARVRAIWTDDEALSTRINREVAHYTGQAELAEVIQEGLEARKAGDEDTATAKLGRAVELAAASGNENTLRLLAGVVDVEDAATGTVRLKARVDDADEMALDTRSTKTVRVRTPE